MIEYNDFARSSEFLQDLNAFWVIISLDCFVVTEVFLFRGVMEQLESGVAESKGVFVPPKILDYDLAFFQSDV